MVLALRLFFFCVLLYKIDVNLTDKLIIIMANGFPGNLYRSYLHLDSLRFFQKRGVWSTFVFPVFPTYTLPNLYTFATGNYPPKHGIVHDYMYDVKKNAYFMGGARESDYESDWWNNSVPFWISATKAGLKVGMYHWPGCNVVYGGVTVKTCVPYYFQSNEEALTVKNVNKLIIDVDSHDLLLAYFDKIDEEGHSIGRHGLSNAMQNNSVSNLNKVLSPLLALAQSDSNINVIVVSGHGFMDSSRHNVVYLEEYLSMDLVHISIGYGAVKLLMAKPGKEHDIFSHLRYRRPIPNVKIYYTNFTRSDLKKHFHYEKMNRIPELVLIADAGHGIYNKPRSSKQVPIPTENDFTFGVHGYDNYHTDMLGLFLAYGPAFKSGYKKDPIFLKDLHDLICEILNILCEPTSGDISRLADILSVKFPPIVDKFKDEIKNPSTSIHPSIISSTNYSNACDNKKIIRHSLCFIPILLLMSRILFL